MKSGIILSSLLLLLAHIHPAAADFVGPSVARHALSPDGRLLVRIKSAKREDGSKKPPAHEVSYYEYDVAKDGYVKRSSYSLSGYLGQMLYVSNAGDLVMISLAERDAIRLYSKDGKLTKSWDLESFLTEGEIKACPATGSTLQWFEEGAFGDRVFFFRGPSRLIRALSAPYTVIRGADEKVTFSAIIEIANAKLTKNEPEAP